LVGLIGSLPGTIELTDGQLVFTALESGTMWPYRLRKLERCVGRAGLAATLDRGEPCEVLRALRAAVRGVTFRWYSFDNGMNLRSPQNTKLPKPRPDTPVEGVAEAELEFLDIAMS
jgi:hypothetical protein